MTGQLGAFGPRASQDSPPWAVRLCQDIVQWVENIRRGPQALTIYTMTTLPDASKYRGGQIQISDESGGEVPAFSDGVNWRRYTDRAICT